MTLRRDDSHSVVKTILSTKNRHRSQEYRFDFECMLAFRGQTMTKLGTLRGTTGAAQLWEWAIWSTAVGHIGLNMYEICKMVFIRTKI